MTAACLEDEGGEVESEGGGQAGPAPAVQPSHPAEVPDFLAAEI